MGHYNYKIVVFLNNDFKRKKALNRRYSLRAFGKYLKIEPSFLSKLLRGNVPISKKMLKNIFELYKLPPEKRNDFYSNYLEVTDKVRLNFVGNVEVNQLSLEHFNVTRDWHHLVILEFARTKEFTKGPKEIARRIGISERKVKASIKSLLLLKLLVKNEDGSITPSHQYNEVYAPKSTPFDYKAAVQRRMKQVLKHAAQSIDNKASTQITTIVAVDSKLMKYIGERMSQFVRDLATELEEKSEEGDQVVELVLYSYPCLK